MPSSIFCFCHALWYSVGYLPFFPADDKVGGIFDTVVQSPLRMLKTVRVGPSCVRIFCPCAYLEGEIETLCPLENSRRTRCGGSKLQ